MSRRTPDVAAPTLGGVSRSVPHDHPVDPGRVERVRAERLSVEEAERFAEVVNLLGDPMRARVLCALLVVDEMCVGDVARALDVSEDSISYSLRVLRTAGFVRRRREGRMSYYRLVDDETVPAVRAALTELRRLVDATAGWPETE